ncbi:MAG: DUF2794 domain-containing protein [Alphaproteobacteria bacterium]|nr:DUF2794 domain-containing protein [Alphaproteobacteria bacterium]
MTDMNDNSSASNRRHANSASSAQIHSFPSGKSASTAKANHKQVTFNRTELDAILRIYGFKVASGEWRDYAIDHLKDRAVFSIFRRSSEMPMFYVEKDPALSRKQGMYKVVATSGHIMKRGHELQQVLKVLEKPLKVVSK